MGCSRSLRMSSRQASCRRSRWMTMRRADTHWAMALAMATPSADMLQPMTNTRFSTTFSTPAMNRYTSGRFVSPVALRMPLPQLYSPIPGRPMAYSFRYSTAPGKNSSLVFSSRSIGSAKNTHTRHTSTPRPRQIRKDEWTVLSTLSLSSMPSPRAAATFTPAPTPISSPVNRDTSVVVEPTAPSAI